MRLFFDWDKAIEFANRRALATGVRHTVTRDRASGLWRLGHR